MRLINLLIILKSIIPLWLKTSRNVDAQISKCNVRVYKIIRRSDGDF